MKVAYLVSRYPAVNHTYIEREVRGLRALGMDVRVASILAGDREPADQTFYVRPLEAVRLVSEQAAFALGRPGAFLRGIASGVRLSRGNLHAAAKHILYIGEAIAVGRWMERNGLRHLHTHFASTTALFVREMFPVTMSATIHGPAEFNDAAGFLLPEKVAAAEFVVAIGGYGASQIMRFTPYRHWGKIHVARLGVDLSEFTPSSRPDDPFQILFVGQLAPAKGIHILLQACAQLLNKGRSFRLRIVGDGPYRQSLEALASELQISAHVSFEGALGQERVREIYRTAGLFAMASFAEGIPVVLMEAMAMEIPCVATRIAGIPELIQHEVNGCWSLPPIPTHLRRR